MRRTKWATKKRRIPRTPAKATCVLIGLAFGFGLGYLMVEARTENQIIARTSDNELQERLDVYRMYMQSGQTGCQMSVENFGTYHAIRREIERRTPTDTTGAETNE